ncbi:MAG: nickel pincer cofactor biosynthesis protein LarC [Dehalococcoidia bacterium]|nr:nickel pincer cofactor biosynthesis protein LarC [Dehalococcoidia bacterium]
MKIAYLDCFAGASGDMLLGAIVDCGISVDTLREELKSLPLDGYKITAERARRGVIAGTKVNVLVDRDTPQPSRNLRDILTILEKSGIPSKAKAQANSIFNLLARAEASVHGVDVDEVRFHEIGAVDSIVDVVGVAIGLGLLGVDKLYASPLTLGSGYITTQHGILPLPAPGTLEIISICKAPTAPPPPTVTPVGETVTPTGAAIICGLGIFERPPFVVDKVGYGLGSREHPELPNALRIWLGHTATGPSRELRLLQTNIDDMNPEIYGYVMEQLFSEGALDVWLTPIQMKKNRPGTILSVLAPTDKEAELVDRILKETSTLGVRSQPVSRYEADRWTESFETSLGTVTVKIKGLNGVRISLAPEYEDCRRIALDSGLPIQEVYKRVEVEVRQKIGLDL